MLACYNKLSSGISQGLLEKILQRRLVNFAVSLYRLGQRLIFQGNLYDPLSSSFGKSKQTFRIDGVVCRSIACEFNGIRPSELPQQTD